MSASRMLPARIKTNSFVFTLAVMGNSKKEEFNLRRNAVEMPIKILEICHNYFHYYFRNYFMRTSMR
jgi:hypothetical protein